MSSTTLEEVKKIVERLEEEDIYNILDGAIFFSGKFEILFYAKKEMSINGYLVMRNKPFYFEIRIYKLKTEGMFTIGVTVGKTHIVKKVEGVI
jgi:hypothetical protein